MGVAPEKVVETFIRRSVCGSTLYEGGRAAHNGRAGDLPTIAKRALAHRKGVDCMNDLLPIELGTVVLDSADHRELSDFYLRMLGWNKTHEVEDWIDIQSPKGGAKLGFQIDPAYVSPAWPEDPPAQQQMLHLDFVVASAEAMTRATEHAIACGARKAEVQYDDRWVVMLDPAGHPFCFVVW